MSELVHRLRVNFHDPLDEADSEPIPEPVRDAQIALPALASPRRTTYALAGQKLQFIRARAAQFLGYLQLISQCFAFNTAYSLIGKTLGPGASKMGRWASALSGCIP